MNEILRESTRGVAEIQLIQGDITLANTDAIVNPANSQLKHEGGLAGLLAKKAGPTFQLESSAWIKENGPVKHESPAYTSAGELPFQYIIHAVGPVWGSGDENRKLKDAVQGSLKIADELGVQSIALPAISTGIFGFPLERATQIAVRTVRDWLDGEPDFEEVVFAVFDPEAKQAYGAALTDP